MRHTENFDNVQVGDEVIYSTLNGMNIYKVTRVTPKQFCAGAKRFRKEDGSEISRFSVRNCYHPTEEDRQMIKRREEERQLNQTLHNFFCQPQNLRYLAIERKRAICDLIKTAMDIYKD